MDSYPPITIFGFISYYLCASVEYSFWFFYRKMRGPETLSVRRPKPEPPAVPGAVPLPVEGCNCGPLAAPPPMTAVGGVPNVTGADGSEPRYCEYARQ
jgi:hypothetical protein